MYSGVATGIFSIRNAGKTTNGDIGRLPVTIGQSAAVIKAGSQYNNPISKQMNSVLKTCDELAKSDKLFNGISKAVKFASDNVNPLIACSSGIKVLMADDKQSALLTEGGCLAGMFIGEGLAKKHLDSILTSLKITGKWAPVVKGLAFVTASIGTSTLGQKIGKEIAQTFKSPKQIMKEELEKKVKTKQINLKS